MIFSKVTTVPNSTATAGIYFVYNPVYPAIQGIYVKNTGNNPPIRVSDLVVENSVAPLLGISQMDTPYSPVETPLGILCYNSTENKIKRLILIDGSKAWGDSTTPKFGVLYIYNNKTYVYNGNTLSQVGEPEWALNEW